MYRGGGGSYIAVNFLENRYINNSPLERRERYLHTKCGSTFLMGRYAALSLLRNFSLRFRWVIKPRHNESMGNYFDRNRVGVFLFGFTGNFFNCFSLGKCCIIRIEIRCLGFFFPSRLFSTY